MGVTKRPASDAPRAWRGRAARARTAVGRLLGSAADWPDLPGPQAYLRLGLALALLSVAVVALPGVPTAVSNPLLAVSMAAINGAVGLALLQLGLLRFGALGNRLDLFAGLAFGTLAVANLGVRLLASLAGGLRLEVGLVLLLFTQALAATLFLAGLKYASHPAAPEQHRRLTVRLLGLVGLLLVAGSAGGLALAGNLSDAVDAGARALLAERAPVQTFLAGQAGWLVLITGVLMVLFLMAAVGYMRASWRLGDPQTAGTATALVLLGFAQLQALLFPPVDTSYVSSADSLRFIAYLTVLLSVVRRLGAEIADRAAREERLRLSRELHDGLAQYLSLLNLRLSRARAPDRPADARARDLEAAQRLLEAALLEARQAIAVLRTGRISWQELTRAVADFADEFAVNHEVDAEVRTEGEVPPVDADLQLEVLRVVQEAFSNAVRHGGRPICRLRCRALRRAWR